MITTASRRIGWTLSALAAAAMALDGAVMWLAPGLIGPDLTQAGPPPGLTTPAGLLALTCAILYLVPRTSTLGAILVTAFVGGALGTHFHLGEVGSPPQLVCVLIDLVAWGGLWFRDPRIRALLPYG